MEAEIRPAICQSLGRKLEVLASRLERYYLRVGAKGVHRDEQGPAGLRHEWRFRCHGGQVKLILYALLALFFLGSLAFAATAGVYAFYAGQLPELSQIEARRAFQDSPDL